MHFFEQNLPFMRNTAILTFFISLLFFTACEKDPTTNAIETASLEFAFTANYDGTPLVINEKEYTYNGKPIRFSKVNFYLSNIILGGTELSDIMYIDLSKTHTSEEGAKEGTVLNFSKIPVDNYSSMAFGIGVMADLNRTTPGDYSTSHPLGSDNSGEYWEAWNSYIFVKIEGQYDVDGDGFDGEDVAFAYHVGQDDLYKKLSADFETPITLDANTPTNLELRLDIMKLFEQDNGELLPLEAHDPNNQMETMHLIMDNFSNALRYVR